MNFCTSESCSVFYTETKSEIAARRLDRMEREKDEVDDAVHKANLQEALTNKTKVVKLVVDKWFVDKCFGYGKAPTGEIVFIHASVVQSAEVLVVGTDAWAHVVSDHARAEGGYRAQRAWGQNAWRQERDKEKANRVAQQVRRAAAQTAQLAAQSPWCPITHQGFATSSLSTLRRLTWRQVAHTRQRQQPRATSPSLQLRAAFSPRPRVSVQQAKASQASKEKAVEHGRGQSRECEMPRHWSK